MEKGKIFTISKINRFSNRVVIFTLAGLIFSCTSCKPGMNTTNMTRNKTAPSKLLDRILELNNTRIGNSEQIILVTNATIHSPDGLIQTFEKKDNHWIIKFTVIKGSVGRNGFSSFQKKREGDNTSPTGIFDLGPVFGYAGKRETQMDYRQATDQDFWIDDPKSDDYNKWVTMENPPTVSHEKMKRDDDLYKLGIVIQYNTQQVVKGDGSAIFIHIEGGRGFPTAGCVAMPEISLERIVQWLQRERNPLIVMGTEEELERIPVY